MISKAPEKFSRKNFKEKLLEKALKEPQPLKKTPKVQEYEQGRKEHFVDILVFNTGVCDKLNTNNTFFLVDVSIHNMAVYNLIVKNYVHDTINTA